MIEKYEELVQWMIDNSIELSGSLKVAPSELGGYGVFAKKSIPADTVLLSVDKKHALSPVSCGISNLLEEHDIDGMIGLTVAYMFEKAQGQASPWFAYLQTIEEEPTEGSLPRFWTEEQQSWLKGTEIEYMGGLDESEVSNVYDEVVKPFVDKYPGYFNGNPKYQTYAGYRDSLMTVCSRAFEVDVYRGLSLVPGACLFNHKDTEDVHFETNADVCFACGAEYCEHIAGEEIENARKQAEEDGDSEFEDINEMLEGVEAPELFDEQEQKDEEGEDEDDDKDTCDIRTIDNINKGEEIFNSYGNLANGILLARYGFSIWDNTDETVSLAPEILHHCQASDELKMRFAWWKDNFYGCVFDMDPDQFDSDDEDNEDKPHPDSISWQELAEILSHGEPTTGLKTMLNVLAMSSKKFQIMAQKVNNKQTYSSVPRATRDGSKLFKDLLKQRQKRYEDGNMSSKEYHSLLDQVPKDNVRKRLAVITRGTEKLVLERALKYKY